MQTARKLVPVYTPANVVATSGAKKNKSTRAAKTKASKAKKPPTSSLFDTIVNVLVGPEHTKFGIHKALLCHRSGYFKGALTGKFKEAREGTVTLEDEDSEVFSRFNAWLYTGSIMKDNDVADMTLGPALQLWLFAEKRLVPGLQNAIIDQLIQHCALLRSRGALKHGLDSDDEKACVSAWDESYEGSRLRAFLVDAFYLHIDLGRTFQEDRAANFPLGLITSIAIRAQKTWVMAGDEYLESLRIGRCERYHMHEKVEGICEELEEIYDDDDVL